MLHQVLLMMSQALKTLMMSQALKTLDPEVILVLSAFHPPPIFFDFTYLVYTRSGEFLMVLTLYVRLLLQALLIQTLVQFNQMVILLPMVIDSFSS
jgi:hypothetical protein